MRHRKGFKPGTLGSFLVLSGVFWLGISLTGAAPQPEVSSGTAHAETRTACQVLTVYDGDTLGCDLNGNGRIERPGEEIRLLGIDSPEMHYSRKNPTYGTEHPTDEPWAAEASQWLTRQTLRKTVYLEMDQRRTDKYNRTLAHVYTQPEAAESLNMELLRAGHARVLFIGPNRLHETAYTQAENEARHARQGVWQGDWEGYSVSPRR